MKKNHKKKIYKLKDFLLPKQEALKLMEGQPYKQELIEELPEGERT